MEEVRNPYAAPQALLEPPVDAREQILASRGIRLGASLLDGVLYSACFVPGYIQVQLLDAASPVHYGPLGTGVSIVLACCGLALFICNLWLLHDRGQTLAKLWLGIRIVRCDGSRAGLARLFWLRSFVPTLLSAIPCLGTLFQLADAVAIFSAEKRCVHDYFADTIVVVA
jgi:uncharacterized RDD family membrane protein YckC